MLPTEALQRYERALAESVDVMFAIGTTAAFPYIHDPVAEASRRGVVTVEINPDETPLSAGDRVEIYRLLKMDPMEARRLRAR